MNITEQCFIDAENERDRISGALLSQRIVQIRLGYSSPII